MIRVVCYTNAAKARLESNGLEVGKTKPYNDQYGIIYWDIPYAPGTLEVVAMNADNKVVSRYQIQTSGQPYALKLLHTEDSLRVKADNGVAQLEIQVVDKVGNPVILADNEVTLNLTGPGRLLGMEAGDNGDMGDYTDQKQRVYHGKIVAYIKAMGKSGDRIHVRLQSPLLEGLQVKVDLY